MQITVERTGELVLSAPPEVGMARLRDFVTEKRFWIYTKLAQKDQLQRKVPRKEFVGGEAFLYLGRSHRLKLVDEQDAPLKLVNGRFALRRDAQAGARDHFIRWYSERARVWLADDFVLKAQASSQHLVAHENQRWFRLKPDLLVKQKQATRLVLDTKWKLLDSAKKNGREKYQLSQADFYQLYAYGHHYLDGCGEIVLIYPKTDAFTEPLPVFEFPKANGMRLWVLPFCINSRVLLLPDSDEIRSFFQASPKVSSSANAVQPL